MSNEPPRPEVDRTPEDLSAHLTEGDVEILWERGDRILVDVEVRGVVSLLWWSADGFGGDPEAVDRLQHVEPGKLTDPVGFLDAVRRAFGDQVVIRLDASD
ncbi:MAG TPA: hypothetical protein PLS63_09925 [Microthrixaceae bacterium]|nr:hypothetical protein [Microthrixaceae bacterium]